MTFENLLFRVIDIENKVKLNDFNIHGINYWPIFRTTIINNSISDNHFFKSKESFSLIYFFKGIINSYKFFFIKKNSFFLCYKNDKSALFQAKKINLHKQYESISLSNKIDQLPILLEVGNPFSKKTFSKSIDISQLYFFIYFISKISFCLRLKKLRNKIRKILNHNEVFKTFSVDLKKRILIDCIDFSVKTLVWSALFKIKTPKELYLKSFNNNYGFASVYICNFMKIDTIEYQHGQQGEDSLTYSNWNKIPKNGFIIMPKYFWLWEEIFKEKFDNWINNQDFHKVKVFGNFWPDYIKSNFPSTTLPEYLNNNKVKILYCMQSPKIDTIILNAMEEIKHVKWFIRLHPRTLDYKDKINEDLKTLNIDFDIQISNSFKFEDILLNSNILITSWSTTAYEAYIYGVKSIVIDKKGYRAYKKFIDKGLIIYAKTCNDIKKEIENI